MVTHQVVDPRVLIRWCSSFTQWYLIIKNTNVCEHSVIVAKLTEPAHFLCDALFWETGFCEFGQHMSFERNA